MADDTRITEDGEERITEDGEPRILEAPATMQTIRLTRTLTGFTVDRVGGSDTTGAAVAIVLEDTVTRDELERAIEALLYGHWLTEPTP